MRRRLALVEELLKETELTILGVDADAARVEALRRHFDAAGFYGTRVELFVGAPAEFPFPPYLASLIVSEDGRAAELPGKVDAARLFNILRPYGGALCLLDDHALDRARPQVNGGRVYVLSQIRQAALSAYDAYTFRAFHGLGDRSRAGSPVPAGRIPVLPPAASR